jgi:hypothetical protein
MGIDLLEHERGSSCLLCDTTGAPTPAELRDPDLGPVCRSCFAHCLAAHRLLHFATLTQKPK